MKNKCASIIFAFLILVSNVGFAFNVHYCGGEVSSISFKTNFAKNNDNEKDCCGISEKKSHCCNDKVFHFQKKTDNAIVKPFSFSSISFFTSQEYKLPVFGADTIFNNNEIALYSCNANAPPIYKLNCQFIFYA